MKAFLILFALMFLIAFARNPQVFIRGIRNWCKGLKRNKAITFKRSTGLFNQKTDSATNVKLNNKV